MGSFNMSCFASQQTIAPGDACRVLPILQQSSYRDITISQGDKQESMRGITHSTCYYDSFCQPVGGFIRATYDDYGRVELDLDDTTRDYLVVLFKEICQRGWNTAQGENEYHDLSFDLPAFVKDKAPALLAAFKNGAVATLWQDGKLDSELSDCWKYMWEVGQKQRLFMSDYQGRARAFNFALIHEDAYAALLEQESAGEDWHGNANAPEAYLRRTFKEADAQQVLDGTADFTDRFFPYHLMNRITDAFARADGTGHGLGTPMSYLVMSLCEQLSSRKLNGDEFIEQCLPLLNDRYILAGLNRLNVRLTPVVTADQDYDNSNGESYAKFVAKVSAKVTRGRKVHMFGEFQPYVMQAASQAHVDALLELIGECDGAIENVIITPGPSGLLDVQFDCTHELSDLREILAEEMEEGGELMSKTVQRRASAA